MVSITYKSKYLFHGADAGSNPAGDANSITCERNVYSLFNNKDRKSWAPMNSVQDRPLPFIFLWVPRSGCPRPGAHVESEHFNAKLRERGTDRTFNPL